MKAYPINNISSNNYINDDVFIFEDLFFYPKNLSFQDSHIKILRNWNIDKIYSNGDLLTKENKEIKETVQNEKEKYLEDLFDVPEEGATDLQEVKEVKGEKTDDQKIVTLSSEEDLKETYKKWIIMTVGFFNNIITTRDINKEQVINLLRDIRNAIKKDKNKILMLFGVPIEGISYIYRKTIETTILAFILAESMNLTEFAISNLGIATLFHDLGMIKIPKPILQKTGQLTPEEVTIIQNHTIIGYKYLKEVNYSVIIASGALQHHERIDGKGYPNKIPAEKITDIAKIISVVDAYCAAISDKPFKDPLHAKDAVQDLLKSGGTAYDPNVLRELVKNISFYPIGSFVLLSNGMPAKVIGASGVAMRPIVKTIILENTENKEGEEIDLSKRQDLYIKGVYRK
ncbi:MAG TPA: HD domain-containing protein [Spirochaetota bacterium]|nr:HD domain-containing protein [Spirochaetota bacterium]HOL57518.1 HD domain-containing protein [Spirochaetota bacterium]HPP05001.1 HD domain-containing protein [Spirochaetota bacterium]